MKIVSADVSQLQRSLMKVQHGRLHSDLILMIVFMPNLIWCPNLLPSDTKKVFVLIDLADK